MEDSGGYQSLRRLVRYMDECSSKIGDVEIDQNFFVEDEVYVITLNVKLKI